MKNKYQAASCGYTEIDVKIREGKAWERAEGCEHRALVQQSLEIKHQITPCMMDFLMTTDMASFKKSWNPDRVKTELTDLCALELKIEAFAGTIDKLLRSHSALRG